MQLRKIIVGLAKKIHSNNITYPLLHRLALWPKFKTLSQAEGVHQIVLLAARTESKAIDTPINMVIRIAIGGSVFGVGQNNQTAHSLTLWYVLTL